MQRYDHFINGVWSVPNNGKTIVSIDPATDEAWAHFVPGDSAYVATAV